MNCTKDSWPLIINRFIQLYEVGAFFNADEEFKIDIDYVEYIKCNERLLHIMGIKVDQLVKENEYMIEQMSDFCQRWQPTGIDPLVNPPINALLTDLPSERTYHTPKKAKVTKKAKKHSKMSLNAR